MLAWLADALRQYPVAVRARFAQGGDGFNQFTWLPHSIFAWILWVVTAANLVSEAELTGALALGVFTVLGIAGSVAVVLVARSDGLVQYARPGPSQVVGDSRAGAWTETPRGRSGTFGPMGNVLWPCEPSP